MTSASWSTMLVISVSAILFHAMPRFSRPDILFGRPLQRSNGSGA